MFDIRYLTIYTKIKNTLYDFLINTKIVKCFVYFIGTLYVSPEKWIKFDQENIFIRYSGILSPAIPASLGSFIFCKFYDNYLKLSKNINFNEHAIFMNIIEIYIDHIIAVIVFIGIFILLIIVFIFRFSFHFLIAKFLDSFLEKKALYPGYKYFLFTTVSKTTVYIIYTIFFSLFIFFIINVNSTETEINISFIFYIIFFGILCIKNKINNNDKISRIQLYGSKYRCYINDFIVFTVCALIILLLFFLTKINT